MLAKSLRVFVTTFMKTEYHLLPIYASINNLFFRVKFPLQELEYYFLFRPRKFADFSKNIQCRIRGLLDVGSSLIAGGAEYTEITLIVGSTLTDRLHVIDVKANFPIRVAWVCIAGSRPTKLTSKAIPFKNLVSELRRDRPGNNGFPFKGLKDVFSRFQIGAVNMTLNLIAFLVSQFADSPSVFTDPTDFANSLCCQHLANVGNEEIPNLVACSHIHLAMKRDSRASSRTMSFV